MQLAIIDCCSHEAYYFGDHYVCCNCIQTYYLDKNETPCFYNKPIYPSYITKDEFGQTVFLYERISNWHLCIKFGEAPFYSTIDKSGTKINDTIGKFIEGLFCTTAF